MGPNDALFLCCTPVCWALCRLYSTCAGIGRLNKASPAARSFSCLAPCHDLIGSKLTVVACWWRGGWGFGDLKCLGTSSNDDRFMPASNSRLFFPPPLSPIIADHVQVNSWPCSFSTRALTSLHPFGISKNLRGIFRQKNEEENRRRSPVAAENLLDAREGTKF